MKWVKAFLNFIKEPIFYGYFENRPNKIFGRQPLKKSEVKSA